MSPEVLSGNYGIECDMWSLGCLLYCLLCGYPPFFGDNTDQILKMVLDGKFVYDDEEWENVSKSAKNLVNQLICKPEKRLSASEALAHPWFEKMLGKTKLVEIDSINLRQLQHQPENSDFQKMVLTAIAV